MVSTSQHNIGSTVYESSPSFACAAIEQAAGSLVSAFRWSSSFPPRSSTWTPYWKDNRAWPRNASNLLMRCKMRRGHCNEWFDRPFSCSCYFSCVSLLHFVAYPILTSYSVVHIHPRSLTYTCTFIYLYTRFFFLFFPLISDSLGSLRFLAIDTRLDNAARWSYSSSFMWYSSLSSNFTGSSVNNDIPKSQKHSLIRINPFRAIINWHLLRRNSCNELVTNKESWCSCLVRQHLVRRSPCLGGTRTVGETFK